MKIEFLLTSFGVIGLESLGTEYVAWIVLITFGTGLGVDGKPDGLGPVGKFPDGGMMLAPVGSPG